MHIKPSVREAVNAVRDVMRNEGRGLRAKQILARVGPLYSMNLIERAIGELIADGALTRAGGVGSGYVYWPANL